MAKKAPLKSSIFNRGGVPAQAAPNAPQRSATTATAVIEETKPKAEETTEDLVPLNFRVPRKLRHRFKAAALQNDEMMVSAITRMIEQYIAKSDKAQQAQNG